VNTGTGHDTVTVSPSAENLDTIQGAVTVVGSGSTTVMIDDQNNSAAGTTYTVTGSAVMRSGSATITHDVMPVILNTGSATSRWPSRAPAGVRR